MRAALALTAAVLACASAWANGVSLSGVSVNASTSLITADLQATRTSCIAPCGVVFDATGTTHATLSEPYRELDYEIDYDDDPGTWATGSGQTDMGRDFAFIGAHTYEVAGTYDVVLTVRDGISGNATDTVQITVIDPDSTGSGYGDSGETVCISKTTDHTGCPSGATQVSTSGEEWHTLLETHIDTNGSKRVLFHRGQTWSRTGSTTPSYDAEDIRIGAYGSGADPILECASCTQMHLLGLVRDNWSVYDLEFGSASGQSPDLAGCHTYGNTRMPRLVTFLRVTMQPDENGGFSHCDIDTINGTTDIADSQVGWVHDRVKATDENSVTGWHYWSYGGFYRSAWIGDEYGITINTGLRIQHGENLLFAHMYSYDNFVGLSLRTNETDTGNIGFGRTGKYVAIVDNDLRNGDPNPSPSSSVNIDVQEGSGGVTANYENVIIRRNLWRSPITGDLVTSLLSFKAGTSGSFGFDVDHNIFIGDDSTAFSAHAFIRDPKGSGHRAYNNSGFGYTTTWTEVLKVLRVPNSISLAANNVVFGVSASEASIGTATTVTNNKCGDISGGSGCASILSTNPFSTSTPTAATDMQSADSNLVDQGATVEGAFREFDGTLLTGTPDIGAWNQ